LPSPVEPESAQAASGAVIQLGTVKEQWSQVQHIAKAHHPSLPALLEHAHIRDLQGDKLILGVRNDNFKNIIEQPDKLAALEAAFYEVLQVPLKIKIVVVGERGDQDPAVDDLLAQDDVLAYGVNELGGEISDFDE
jgi:hypothetical protein